MTPKSVALLGVRLGGIYLTVRAVALLLSLTTILIEDDIFRSLSLPTKANSDYVFRIVAFLLAVLIEVLAGLWVLSRSDSIALRLLRGIPDQEWSEAIPESNLPGMFVGVLGVLLIVLSIPAVLGTAAKLEPVVGASLTQIIRSLMQPQWVCLVAYTMQLIIGFVLFVRSRWFCKAWVKING